MYGAERYTLSYVNHFLCKAQSLLVYDQINDVFSNRATLLIRPLIVGLEGGRIKKASLYNSTSVTMEFGVNPKRSIKS